MFVYEHQIRVRYAETDKMGYVYYGNYATYFEVARVEALRSIGINYNEMEKNGTIMPVSSYSTKFIKPAYYDDLLTIKLMVKKSPALRFYFNFETYNESGFKINEAEVVLAFVDVKKKKACLAPDFLTITIDKFLK